MESAGLTKLRRQKLELLQLGLLGQQAREKGTEGRECRIVQSSPLECPAAPYAHQGDILDPRRSTGKQYPNHLWRAHIRRETRPRAFSRVLRRTK